MHKNIFLYLMVASLWLAFLPLVAFVIVLEHNNPGSTWIEAVAEVWDDTIRDIVGRKLH